MRFLLGPFCDNLGARVLFSLVLCFTSIPIGTAGGTFVMCQFWTSRMFTKEVVGTANALVAGWGNWGERVTQFVMGTARFPLFKFFFDGDAEKAWRTVCAVPAVVAFGIGVLIYFISDNSPKGQYSELTKHGVMPEISAVVELTMNNAAALYFKDEFDLTTEEAAAFASIFGWMNLFARGSGGFLSDKLNARLGMRGRIIAQTVCLAGEAALVIVFANTASLGAAIIGRVFFSLFVQAAEGTTFGIGPYIYPPSTGSISGEWRMKQSK